MAKKFIDKIGPNIQKIRKDLGMTVEELADKLKTSKGYLSGIETGKRLPSLPMLEKIAQILKVDPRRLL